ncbi:MAG: endonuclease/exonuclease/phosphatase family protein [Labilithrix sp.]|nr:endonuclease/exonuclease/phosphatase family protein [Labilithrix sp.]
MGSGRNVWTVVVVAALASVLGACAVETDEDEPVGEETQEVSTGRCVGTRAKTTAMVRVMTVNLRHDSDQWQRRFELIADEIARLDPDVIGLQEIEIADDQANRLNALLAKRGHAKYHVFAKRKSGVRGFFTGEGVGVMSRWPIVEKHHEDTGEMRISVLARVKHPSGGFIDVANTHLDHRGGADGDARRDDQARQTVDLVDRHDDCWPAVLTGDMNATESSPALVRFKNAGFVDSYRDVHGADAARTGNTSSVALRDGAFTQNPKKRIDFVLGRSAGRRTVTAVDSLVCFKNHDAKGFYPSDHFGVMTTSAMRL